MNKDKLKLPGLVAHRGYSSHYPENTLRAFQEAFLCGACFVECDVQLSKDQVPVVYHDRNLSRVSGVTANVRDLNFAELRKFSAAFRDRFDNQFVEEKISSLEEFTDLLSQWPNRQAFIEIKRSSLQAFGMDSVLETTLPILEKVCDQVVIISFDKKIVEHLSQEEKWRTGWVTDKWSDEIIQMARQLKPEFFFIDVDCLPSDMQHLPESNWYTVLYEIDNPALAEEWVHRGADFIETNDIMALLQTAAFNNAGCTE